MSRALGRVGSCTGGRAPPDTPNSGLTPLCRMPHGEHRDGQCCTTERIARLHLPHHTDPKPFPVTHAPSSVHAHSFSTVTLLPVPCLAHSHTHTYTVTSLIRSTTRHGDQRDFMPTSITAIPTILSPPCHPHPHHAISIPNMPSPSPPCHLHPYHAIIIPTMPSWCPPLCPNMPNHCSIAVPHNHVIIMPTMVSPPCHCHVPAVPTENV